MQKNEVARASSTKNSTVRGEGACLAGSKGIVLLYRHKVNSGYFLLQITLLLPQCTRGGFIYESDLVTRRQNDHLVTS